MAFALARELIQRRPQETVPQPEEFLSAGMLHDSFVPIAKARKLAKEKEKKGVGGILKKAGVSGSDEIVRGTNAFALFSGPSPVNPNSLSWRTKIMLLADNHVANDTIVPLSDRREYHYQKFPTVPGRTRQDVDQVFDSLEKIERDLMEQKVDVPKILASLAKRYPSRTKQTGFIKY